MNPVLLNDIHYVEAKYGSVCNPLADLTKIHKDVLNLGLVENRKKLIKNKLYVVHNIYFTFNPKLMKCFYLCLNHKGVTYIRQHVHLDVSIIRNVRRVIESKHKLRLINKNALKAIVG